jgi:hypothetical protein
MSMLDLEDSSIMEQKILEKPYMQPEVALVSSKQVPINKLDLKKVEDI